MLQVCNIVLAPNTGGIRKAGVELTLEPGGHYRGEGSRAVQGHENIAHSGDIHSNLLHEGKE